jgi:TRAP-type C4-dicarboxylate transport system permease large subunit
MMPVILLGGIYSGATTPTEAAAIAAAYAFARTTASIGMLIAGALVFNYVVTIENIPRALSTFLRI